MGSKPVIGITTYSRDEDGKFFLPGNYVDAVRRSGGLPLLLPHGESDPQDLVDILDGLILPGGGDLDPSTYGGRAHETMYWIDAERDDMEIDLARRAVKMGLPTLGICRGTQVLNVALGGTLIEHLPDEVGDQTEHRAPPRKPVRHRVTVQSGSRLARIMGHLEFDADSWHHQALRRVVPSLRVVARAPDGTIEAVEMPDHPWLIGVQWHPELSASTDPVQQRLFHALIEAACAGRGDSAA